MPDREAPGQLRMAFVADELDELDAKIKRHHRERGSQPDTFRAVRSVFRILDALGVHTLSELADETLDSRFVALTESRGLADTTRETLRGHLHALIRLAHQWGLLPCEPTLPRRVKPGGRQWREEHPPSTRTLSPSPDVVRRVLDYLDDRKDTWTGFRSYAYLATIAKTRLPLMTAIRLRKDNILLRDDDPLAKGDLDLFPTPVFRLRSRGGKELRLPIPTDLATILDEWIPKNGSQWRIFPGLTKDGPWFLRSSHSETPASVLRAACLALGLEPFTCEQLRGSLVASRSQTTGMAPPLDISPPASAPHSDHQDLDQAAPTDRLDEIAYADKLLEKGFQVEAAFVRHFQGRTLSTWQDIVEAVWPGEEREWVTVRSWVNRVKNALREVDPSCPLNFGTKERGHLVVKRHDPLKQPCNRTV